MNQQAIQLTEGTELGAEEGWLSNLSEAPVEAICQPILDYHRAQERRNLELLSASISDIVYRVYCAATDRFVDWEPWTRLTREQIVGNFGKAFEHPDYHYHAHQGQRTRGLRAHDGDGALVEEPDLGERRGAVAQHAGGRREMGDRGAHPPPQPGVDHW
jgi:hypothetical protein